MIRISIFLFRLDMINITANPTAYQKICLMRLLMPDPSRIRLNALYKAKQLVRPIRSSIATRPKSIRNVNLPI